MPKYLCKHGTKNDYDTKERNDACKSYHDREIRELYKLWVASTFFSKNSPLNGATANSCTMGTSLLPSILNLKINGIPFGIPTLQHSRKIIE